MMKGEQMEKKKRLGIFLIILALIFAGFFIRQSIKKPEEKEVPKTLTKETTAPITKIPETSYVPETESVTGMEQESITEEYENGGNIYIDEHHEIQPMKVKYPEGDVMALIENDKEGLNNAIQAYVNGYGYLDAQYAEFAGDVEINTYDELVTLTYFLNYKRDKGKYFYLIYNKKTKEWSSRPV